MITILDDILTDVNPLVVFLIGLMLNWLIIFIISLIERLNEKLSYFGYYSWILNKLRSGKFKSNFSKILAIFLFTYFPILVIVVILRIIFMIYHAGE
jgi:hypothetical protein